MIRAITIPGTARINALVTLFLKVCTSNAKAASKIKVGKNTYSMICGSMLPAHSIDWLKKLKSRDIEPIFHI